MDLWWREPIEPWGEAHQYSVENVGAGSGNASSGGGALGPKAPIAEERRHRPREPVGVGNGFGCAGYRQFGCHARAIADMRPMKYRAVEPGRLERIVTAFGNKGSTDEGYPGETVEQPELTHRVSEVDICLIGDRLAAAASGDTQSALGQHHVNSVAARRMTRNDYRQEAGVARCDVTMDARGNVFLAGVRAGRNPKRALLDPTGQLL